MTLHIFNPGHDLALASGLANFTAPHAARQLRHDLGFLPALWADAHDAVLTDDAEQASRQWNRLRPRLAALTGRDFPKAAGGLFIDRHQQAIPWEAARIAPWGWDAALRAELRRRGADEGSLPGDDELDTIRQLSHRRTAAGLLQTLGTLSEEWEGMLVGEACECTTPEQVEALLARHGQLVLKAPWSSSGRGVRFCPAPQEGGEETPPEGARPWEGRPWAGWLRNVLARQGSIMAEPYYNKVKDFGMEFTSDGQGTVRYEGLSLFHTQNGAYTGNILATEATKRQMLGRYLPLPLLDAVREKLCRELGRTFQGRYRGPFGIDMMVVRPHCLHPCVELNLRRTMGHAALALSPADDDVRAVMRIAYDGKCYKLKFNKL